MPAQTTPVAPFDLVVFGGTGDLAFRKLLPSLYQRHRAGQIPPDARIIGAARAPMPDDAYRKAVAAALADHLPAAAWDRATIDAFLARLTHIALDATTDGGWLELARLLRPASDRIRVFYLAVAPDLIAPICARIGAHGLVTSMTRVVVEKPLGHDLPSALATSAAVGEVFAERQVFRIDHYLGKGMVQNLMALRFANALFEPLWNAAHIDHVEISVTEDGGVGRRGAYYDHTGALRDVVQNHILQLLCLIAMEPPSRLEADAVRDEKIKALRSLMPIDATNAAERTVRGQYGRGADVLSYADEIGRQTRTETYVALRAEIGTWRWAGVPFYLRTGKRLASRVSEIVIAFRPIPHSIFPPGSGDIHANRLVLRVQPDETVKLWLMERTLQSPMHLTCVPLEMSLGAAGIVAPDAYERLLMDVVRGDQTLFMRRDEVEAAWEWIDPIIAAWSSRGSALQFYAPGSWGPANAAALLARDGRRWHEPA